jgi:hypothetical protein
MFVVFVRLKSTFNHSSTIFYHEIGHATPHKHPQICIDAAFHKLNSLRVGFSMICPNKRSGDGVEREQTATVVANNNGVVRQTLTSTCQLSLTQAKKAY